LPGATPARIRITRIIWMTEACQLKTPPVQA
jgi:hypothetical protein